MRSTFQSQHFTVFGGSFVHENRGFAPADRSPSKHEELAVWGFVLATLLFGITTVATATLLAWPTVAQAGLY
jgi:hypothetical protein